MNLFGEEFEQPACSEVKNKPPKKGKVKSSSAQPKGLKEVLPSRVIQVKMYSDFYRYEAPEDLKEPTLEDVRIWMVSVQGFTELTDPKRAGLTIISPEEQDAYVFCGVKFEKMG